MSDLQRHLVLVLAAVVLVTGCTSTGGDQGSTAPSGPADASSTSQTTDAESTTESTTESTEPLVDGCEVPASPLTTRRTEVVTSGQAREFLVEVPTDLDPATPTPVILNFHGSSSDMDQQSGYSRLPEAGAARGYVVVTPQGSGEPRGWSFVPSPDDQFVADILTTLDSEMCVDADRVYAAGVSNGSAFSALATCREPYRFRAVAMVAATVPDTCPAEVDVAAIAFHGTADAVVPYGGGEIDSAGSNGAAAPDAEPAIATWATHNGCDPTPVDTALGVDVVERVWNGCDPGAPVVFYRIDGGGHTWPGSADLAALGFTRLGATTTTIDATELMLDFFDRVGN